MGDLLAGDCSVIGTSLGVGGMGEVYRARDERLGRDVAVKVLPPAVAENPERMARFGREARALAALYHPNILAIYDFGSERGITYAVTELLEGNSLRHRLDRGSINYPMLAKGDPLLQPLRGEPRFQRLLDCIRPEWERFVPRFPSTD